MSSNNEDYLDASPRLTPFQSAQPQGSLFGGPSSQDIDLEPHHPAKQEGDNDEQEDSDVLMPDFSLIDNDLSDDADYESDDATEPAGRARISQKPRRERSTTPRSTITRELSSSPPSYSDRPNRFQGADSTWKNLTAEDRLIAESLETARARDLAAHLYNSFALRERARRVADETPVNKRKHREVGSFIPPKFWAAWPMPANEVPRVGEHLRRQEDDEWTWRMPPDPRPSAELEESIMAIMMKTAKERFESREWVSDSIFLRERASATPFGDDGIKGYQDESDQESMDDGELRPMVQADDEKPRRQLRPLTRNILTQFDQLLMGLHHARMGVVNEDNTSASEWQSDTESSISRTPSPHRASRKATENPTRESSRSRSPQSPRSPMTSKSSKRRIRLGIRDWSDVLGIASMTGWSPAVVNRAAQRCADLFGEDMAFRTLKEGRARRVPTEGGREWEYMESDAERALPRRRIRRKPPKQETPATREPSMVAEEAPPPRPQPRPKGRGEHRRADLKCPVKKCKRHEHGFSRVWNLNQHVLRMHPNYRWPEAEKKESITIAG